MSMILMIKQLTCTDPHVGNIGIALPQLEQFEEDDITGYFSSPEIIPVVPRDPKFPMNSIPPYLVQSVIMTDFLKLMKALPAGSVTVKILGFGRAYRISQAVPNLLGAAPEKIRPPEVVLHELCDGRIGSTWSEVADIWALGCTIIFSRQSNSVDLPQKLGRKFGKRKIGNTEIVGISALPLLIDSQPRY
ncbi:hypothetical protein E4U56_001265 [Claviceps arundinis]|uniref:Uncharacterized protein n=1 Tax=Claviceps arundinis TaxID=1623583 RepID=A0A9P7MSP8_9HYPO|nr:hypothetical protein E4U56_001265 [Claviceps arundinis]